MKHSIIKIGLLAAAIQFTACNKEDLSPVPTDSIGGDFVFDNALRIEGQVKAKEKEVTSE